MKRLGFIFSICFYRIYKKAGLLNKKKAETQYVVAKKGLGKSRKEIF